MDLSIISSLVDAALHTLDDVLLPAANWMLALYDAKGEIETTIGIKFSCADVAAFQSRVAEPFYSSLKENIQNRFSSKVIPTDSVTETYKPFSGGGGGGGWGGGGIAPLAPT